MELNEYQKRAMTTCMESCDNFSYMFINLVGEVGEFASKVAKQIRQGNFILDENHLSVVPVIDDDELSKEFNDYIKQYKTEMQKEAGDILWQLSGLCKVMGWDLEEVAQMNLDKLASRQKRGVIDSNGDNR